MNPFEPLRIALTRTTDSHVTITGTELWAACAGLPATDPHVSALALVARGAEGRNVMLPRGHVERLLALVKPEAIGPAEMPLTA